MSSTNAGNTGQTGTPKTSLKAVLFLDLASSSRFMSEREDETIAFLSRCFDHFTRTCSDFRGQLVKTTGDGAMLLFESATDAIEFAMAMHEAVADLREGFPSTARFRAGIHIGEVMFRGGDAYGHAVNVAARLEGLAGSGGTCVSQEVYMLVQRTSRFGFEAIGGRRMKNIPEHMRVYQVLKEMDAADNREIGQLSVRTIGGLSVSRDEQSLPVGTRGSTKGLLAYLVVSPNGVETVGRLNALLWPDRPFVEAKKSMNRLVSSIRRQSGLPVEWAEGSVVLNHSRLEIDLERMENDLRQGYVDPVLNRDGEWPDRILAGLEDVGPLFNSWLAVARSEWRNRIATALELCLDMFEIGDDGARDAAMALVRIEPGHERAARMLIRYYHAVDNPGAARRVYTQLENYLTRYFGISPKPETVAALRGDNTAAAPVRTRASTAPLRIQVTEFEALTDEDREIANAFRKELLASLSCFRGWSAVEGEQAPSLSAGVSDYKLSATLTSAVGRPEIVLTLGEAHSGGLVWSDRLVLEPENLQAVKQRAIGRIAATLEVYISTDRLARTTEPEMDACVDQWLQGEKILTRWTPQSHDEAASIFTRIIDHSPSFAPAYASLASLKNVRHIVRPGLARDSEDLRQAYRLAQMAVELDPLDARNQLAVAWSSSLDDKFENASIHMELAAKLNPHSPRTLISCAMGFAFFGDHDRAMELLAHSIEYAPILLDYQWSYAASVYFLAGEHEKAIEAAIRSSDRIIDNPGWHAAALAAVGRREEAATEFKRLCSDVSAIWAGATAPTRTEIARWFSEAYPIREEKDRARLLSLMEQTALEQEP
ncbi:adenylate/guanylate cyclase domain-containing protein [Hoeflea sp. CAU 1731]